MRNLLRAQTFIFDDVVRSVLYGSVVEHEVGDALGGITRLRGIVLPRRPEHGFDRSAWLADVDPADAKTGRKRGLRLIAGDDALESHWTVVKGVPAEARDGVRDDAAGEDVIGGPVAGRGTKLAQIPDRVAIARIAAERPFGSPARELLATEVHVRFSEIGIDLRELVVTGPAAHRKEPRDLERGRLPVLSIEVEVADLPVRFPEPGIDGDLAIVGAALPVELLDQAVVDVEGLILASIDPEQRARVLIRHQQIIALVAIDGLEQRRGGFKLPALVEDACAVDRGLVSCRDLPGWSAE